jgi:hypothetical protein
LDILKRLMTALVAQEPFTVIFNRIFDAMTAMTPEISKLSVNIRLGRLTTAAFRTLADEL